MCVELALATLPSCHYQPYSKCHSCIKGIGVVGCGSGGGSGSGSGSFDSGGDGCDSGGGCGTSGGP